jgi:heme A synthase
MKWFIIILVIGIGIAIYTGNMGGAKDAAANYNKVMRPGQ